MAYQVLHLKKLALVIRKSMCIVEKLNDSVHC